jgi:hypothetical protein
MCVELVSIITKVHVVCITATKCGEILYVYVQYVCMYVCVFSCALLLQLQRVLL